MLLRQNAWQLLLCPRPLKPVEDGRNALDAGEGGAICQRTLMGEGVLRNKEGPLPSFIVESPSGPLPQAGEGTNGPNRLHGCSIDRRHG